MASWLVFCNCQEPEPIYEQDNVIEEDGIVLLYEQGGWWCEKCNKVIGGYDERDTE